MSGVADSEDGATRVDVVGDVPHLLVGQFAQPNEEHQQVGVAQGFEAGDVAVEVGVDEPGVGVDGEEDGAAVAVAVREDVSELAHPFFRAVVLFAGDEDDVLSAAQALTAGEAERGGLGTSGDCEQAGRHEEGGQPGETGEASGHGRGSGIGDRGSGIGGRGSGVSKGAS